MMSRYQLSKSMGYMPYLALALSFLIPNLTQPWLAFYRNAWAFAFVVLLTWQLYYSRNTKISFSWPLGCMALGLVCVWLQYCFGLIDFYGTALNISLFLMGAALAWLCGGSMAQMASTQAWYRIIWVVYGSALLSAAIGLCQWLGYDGWWMVLTLEAPPGSRIISNMGQPNHLGTLLLMGLAALLYLRQEGEIRSNMHIMTATTLLTLAVVLTESKTAILSLMAMLLFGIFSLIRFRDRQLLSMVQTTAYCAALALVLFTFLPEIKHGLWHAEAALPGGRGLEGTVSSRLIIYHQVINGIWAEPWWGYGWLNTLMAVKQGALSVAGYESATYAHNFFLDLLAWFGLPVGTVIIAMIVYWSIKYLIIRLQVHTVGVVLMVIPFGVHSMTEFPFAFAYFLLTVMIFLGFLHEKVSVTPRLLDAEQHIMKKCVLMLSTVIMSFGLLMVYVYIQAERQFYLLRLQNNKVHLSEPYQYKKTYIYDQLDTLLALSDWDGRSPLHDDDMKKLTKMANVTATNQIQYYHILALAMANQQEDFLKEVTMVSRIKNDAFSQSLYMALDEHPNIAPDLKYKAKSILQDRLGKNFIEKPHVENQ